MSARRIQTLFFLGVLAITLHFGILFSQQLIGYLALNQSAPARITQWEIVPIKSRFGLKADYTFSSKEKTYQGSSLFAPPHYLNEMAALSALKVKAKEPQTVYFRSQNPQNSALEKTFSWNLLFRLCCSLGVIVYFVLLNKRLITSYKSI